MSWHHYLLRLRSSASADNDKIVLILFVVGIVAFVVQRKMRQKTLRNRVKVRHISQISAPNGLGGSSGNIPPTYYEALKSPAVSASTFSSVPTHQRQRSDEALLEQCWAAVYDAEDGGRRDMPPSPAYAPSQYSPSRTSGWVRSQSPSDSGSTIGPLSGNPSLPAPPSPSYSGVLPTSTASASRTPMTSTTNLVAPPLLSPYQEPQSARSFSTRDDRLSIRASIPESVLYPSPLQPAPSTRQFSEERRSRQDSVDTVDSAVAYGSATWRTLTPHEDPPEYEPRRGNPDSVSPV